MHRIPAIIIILLCAVRTFSIGAMYRATANIFPSGLAVLKIPIIHNFKMW